METSEEQVITSDDVGSIDALDLDLTEPEDSDVKSDGAETPEAEQDSESCDDAAASEDELEEADSAPEPPLRCGVVPGTQSNLGSRQRRQNRQRGR